MIDAIIKKTPAYPMFLEKKQYDEQIETGLRLYDFLIGVYSGHHKRMSHIPLYKLASENLKWQN